MISKFFLIVFPSILLFFSCTNNKAEQQINNEQPSSKKVILQIDNQKTIAIPFKDNIYTKNTQSQKIIQFAKTLIGVPYKYGSNDVNIGFDCSGFITYVFNHFDIDVPRSSVDYTNVAREVRLSKSKPGDLILFTGTDSSKRTVGHMGIITQTTDTIKFIHSTSGKAYGVTETPLNKYYQGRFVKTIRIFD